MHLHPRSVPTQELPPEEQDNPITEPEPPTEIMDTGQESERDNAIRLRYMNWQIGNFEREIRKQQRNIYRTIDEHQHKDTAQKSDWTAFYKRLDDCEAEIEKLYQQMKDVVERKKPVEELYQVRRQQANRVIFLEQTKAQREQCKKEMETTADKIKHSKETVKITSRPSPNLQQQLLLLADLKRKMQRYNSILDPQGEMELVAHSVLNANTYENLLQTITNEVQLHIASKAPQGVIRVYI
jgi:chromosome segregation ATPase